MKLIWMMQRVPNVKAALEEEPKAAEEAKSQATATSELEKVQAVSVLGVAHVVLVRAMSAGFVGQVRPGAGREEQMRVSVEKERAVSEVDVAHVKLVQAMCVGRVVQVREMRVRCVGQMRVSVERGEKVCVSAGRGQRVQAVYAGRAGLVRASVKHAGLVRVVSAGLVQAVSAGRAGLVRASVEHAGLVRVVSAGLVQAVSAGRAGLVWASVEHAGQARAVIALLSQVQVSVWLAGMALVCANREMQMPKAMAKAGLVGSGPPPLTKVEFAVGTVPMPMRIVSVLDAEAMPAPPPNVELVTEDRILAVTALIQMVSVVEAHAVEVAVNDNIFNKKCWRNEKHLCRNKSSLGNCWKDENHPFKAKIRGTLSWRTIWKHEKHPSSIGPLDEPSL
jgi:hypothetical protein